MSSVLVADHDPASRRLAAAGLRDGGYDVEMAQSRERLRTLLRRRQLIGVVVDPGTENPVELVKDIRMRTDLPLIVVSERADEWDKVELLDAGADDYLTKPYGTDELLARLRAVLRRSRPPEDDAPIITDDFMIDLSDRRFVGAHGTEVPLSPTEWRIVEVLVRHPGHLVTQTDVLRLVWGPEAINKTEYLRVHMANIRRKVEPDPARPRYFLTVAGLGLRFVPEPTAAKRLA